WGQLRLVLLREELFQVGQLGGHRAAPANASATARSGVAPAPGSGGVTARCSASPSRASPVSATGPRSASRASAPATARVGPTTTPASPSGPYRSRKALRSPV